jgi:hypothetical protein
MSIAPHGHSTAQNPHDSGHDALSATAMDPDLEHAAGYALAVQELADNSVRVRPVRQNGWIRRANMPGETIAM